MYMVIDFETENHTEYKRFASQFSKKNYRVADGWKIQGDSCCSWEYHSAWHRKPFVIPDNVTMLVGHNLKYDLLWIWDHPSVRAFFKRGGRIWCTQYAEYLINGQAEESLMTSLDSIVEKYGGRKKIDEVKLLWEAGYLTSQIEKELLIDYLVGRVDEGRNSGDIGNTEKVFLGQIKIAAQQGQLNSIAARMDGLCATTEMEFNGLAIDQAEGKRRAAELDARITELDALLSADLPEFPDGFKFNWNSGTHKSALIFGGTLKYKKPAPYLDDTGKYAREKIQQRWPLFDNVPVDPAECTVNANGMYVRDGVEQDTYKSGIKKGTGKFKLCSIEGELKTKIQTFLFTLPGMVRGKREWQGAQKDAAGQLIYSTRADVIEEIAATNDTPFLKLLQERQDVVKDLGTYYIRYDPSTNEHTGMLTCVDPDTGLVHHSLNHTNTITTRLSSNNPNMQNIPREGTSQVKKLFISRFENGVILEADYSQLEVVVQGVLTNDAALCEDLRNRVDFHCKRVAFKYGISYEDAKDKCKNENNPEFKIWKPRRTQAKEFSFQRAYGAGAAAIALSTGMAQEEVEKFIEAEEAMYPGVVKFNAQLEADVKAAATPYIDYTRDGNTYHRSVWVAPTKTRYTFVTSDAPDWLQSRGIRDSFKPTELKNYPVQGTGAEFVQLALGKLWRAFVATDNFGCNALLINTVHDCVWVDCRKDWLAPVGKVVKTIMEAIPHFAKQVYGMEITVPFPVELEIGPNLLEKKEYHV